MKGSSTKKKRREKGSMGKKRLRTTDLNSPLNDQLKLELKLHNFQHQKQAKTLANYDKQTATLLSTTFFSASHNYTAINQIYVAAQQPAATKRAAKSTRKA